jgi:hypothetical protein
MVKAVIKKQLQQAVRDRPHLTPKLFALEAHLQRRRWPLRWEAWGSLAVLLTTLTGAVSATFLLHQPTTQRSCDHVFWPFASASFRLYCAQAAADQKTLEKLLWAINLLSELPKEHPLRLELDRRIETWAKQVLDLAENTFQQGELDRAIEFAQQIPENTSAYPLVEGRVARWQEIWDQGDIVYRRSVAALKDEDWRKAFAISLDLMEVDNRYWADNQFQKLNQRIIVAQRDSSHLNKAKQFLAQGGVDNLKTALDLISQLAPSSDFLRSARTLREQVATALIEVANAAIARQDLPNAMAAAQLVPSGTQAWPQAQDFITLANAESLTWGDNIPGLEQAIRAAQGIGADRPLHLKAQELIFAWKADIQAVRIVQQAQAKAQPGDMDSLQAALAIMQQVPPGISSYRFRSIQQQMATWQAQLLTLRDRPVLDEAIKAAEPGTVAALQQAISIAARIPDGHPLYSEARGQILTWQERLNALTLPPDALNPPSGQPPGAPSLGGSGNSPRRWLALAQELAAQGTPAALTEAILVINQIPAESELRAEAEQSMLQWSRDILSLAQRQAATNLEQAIAIAKQVPAVTSVYAEAQAQIQAWQGQL